MRKQYHNELIDAKGKIRVYCRIRPLSHKEIERGEMEEIEAVDEFQVRLRREGGLQTYDSVFAPNATQEQVFEDTRKLVQSAIDGYNVCIFAYGATGSGKTHTIQGVPNQPGICPRAISELFNTARKLQDEQNQHFKIYCTMVELYMNKLSDLLYDKYQNEEGKMQKQQPLKI